MSKVIIFISPKKNSRIFKKAAVFDFLWLRPARWSISCNFKVIDPSARSKWRQNCNNMLGKGCSDGLLPIQVLWRKQIAAVLSSAGYGQFVQLLRCKFLKTKRFPANLRLVSEQIDTYHFNPADGVYDLMSWRARHNEPMTAIIIPNKPPPAASMPALANTSGA